MNKLNNKIKENFTTIPNSVIRNKNLSDRARFLFCYMASMSDDWGDGLDKKAIEPIKVIPDGEIDPKELLIKVRQCRTKKALRELWDSNPAYQDYPFMFGHQSTKIKYNDYRDSW